MTVSRTLIVVALLVGTEMDRPGGPLRPTARPGPERGEDLLAWLLGPDAE